MHTFMIRNLKMLINYYDSTLTTSSTQPTQYAQSYYTPARNKNTKFERWKIVLIEVPESLLAWLLVEKSETHIVVFFGWGFGLGFFLWCFGSGSITTSGGGTSGSWAWTNTRTDVSDQAADIDVLEGTSEEWWPEWFKFDVGGLKNDTQNFTMASE